MRTAEMSTGALGVTIALAASFSTLAYVQADKQVDRVATRIETLETKVSHQEDELEKLRLRSELSDIGGHGHPVLQNQLVGCAPPGHEHNVLLHKMGPTRCYLWLVLSPTPGGACPTDLDIVLDGTRAEIRGEKLSPDGSLHLVPEMDCGNIEREHQLKLVLPGGH